MPSVMSGADGAASAEGERALADAADPELARVALSRLAERPPAADLLRDPSIEEHAVRLLGFSVAAADYFLAHPGELASLADLSPRAAERLEAEAGDDVAALGPSDGLRRFRRRGAYRLAARDLAGAGVEDVMTELTGIAEACLRVAVASAAPSSGLAVLGMGKLGGGELNYSSDVDVIFVHPAAGPEAATRAAAEAAAVTELLSAPRVEGIALRVDAALRPEGRAGPLSRSLESTVEYYRRHAEVWERQALLKARPVAGDLALGQRLLDALAPFVYPAVLPTAAVEEVRASKVRIEEHVRSLGKESVELKRGRGGIRDVEFAVQLLQLVHGGRDEHLRVMGTLDALAALGDGGYVRQADAAALADAYRFLRRLEHRLQMRRDLQTHELPSELHALTVIARAAGHRDAAGLLAEYASTTEVVRTLHERLFYRPLMEALASSGPARAGADRATTEELLAGLGFADPSTAFDLLAGVVDPKTRLGKVTATLFPVIGPALAEVAPDAALVRLARVEESMLADPALGDDLADELAERPDAARRLAALTGASSAFTDMLVARPELVRSLYHAPAPEARLFPGATEPDLVRVAGAFAARELRVPDLGRRLSSVAEVDLSAAVAEAESPVPLAVAGLGRLGAEELSFASDLDVVFVYEGEGPDDFREACLAAERVMEGIRRRGWVPDADLRPEGRSGPLARSIASYLEYWSRWAETWEFQSLLRIRAVAGNELLGRRLVANARDVAYPERLTRDQVIAVRRMRVRMEEERVRPKGTARHHFKLGYGGLADVQFALELSLMRDGAAHPQIRRTHTIEALEAIVAEGLLDPSVARDLSEAFLFLSEIKAMLEIERRLPAEALPPTPEGQAALAARLGYGERGRHRLLQDYRRITWRARRAMERVFYGEGP
jgi:glutamate-ammonia-ligase adenylyltransferase